MKNRLIGIIIFLAIVIAGFFYVSHQTIFSHGKNTSLNVVEIQKGDSVIDVSKKLQDLDIISWRGYFIYYFWKEGWIHSIVAGKYQLSGNLSIPEIAGMITRGEVAPKDMTIVFPEGWDSQKISNRLSANGFPGDEFLKLVRNPKLEWRDEFWFLKNIPPNASLEGYLFPDTYTFALDASAETIVRKMLNNFERKFSDDAKAALERQGRTIFDIVTLASIVENEVQSESDRKMVADLFWRRINIEQPLQSDATIKYIRGENVVQHSFEETRVESPYNTYVNKGLPPGPISNPGLESLLAVVFPTPNPYFYFLSDTQTGETIFSVTFEEHVANKQKHGL